MCERQSETRDDDDDDDDDNNDTTTDNNNILSYRNRAERQIILYLQLGLIHYLYEINDIFM